MTWPLGSLGLLGGGAKATLAHIFAVALGANRGAEGEAG